MNQIKISRELFNIIKEYHQNLDDDMPCYNKIFYEIDNTFLKSRFLNGLYISKIKNSSKSNFKYVIQLYELLNKVMNLPGSSKNIKNLSYHSFNNKHRFIRRLLYKDNNEDLIKVNFNLSKQSLNKNERLCLIEYALNTRISKTDYDVSKILNTLKYDEIDQYIKIYEIEDMDKIFLRKNRKSYHRKIYQMMIISTFTNSPNISKTTNSSVKVEDDKIGNIKIEDSTIGDVNKENRKMKNVKKENVKLKNVKVEDNTIIKKDLKIKSVRAISDSFSLICFRRMLKTSNADKSFFERDFNLYESKKPNDFLYYLNVFFDGETFNKKFEYRLNFNKFAILLKNDDK